MVSFLTWIGTGIVSFAATNIDDIFVLTIFFSQVNKNFRRRHVVIGQYVGICALILISTLGFFGTLLIPKEWIGLLGFAPIVIGIKKFLSREKAAEGEKADAAIHREQQKKRLLLNLFFSSYVLSVASVTFANGGDNIGIYVPLFASGSMYRMIVIILTFLILVSVWCYAGYKLANHPRVAKILERYGHIITPVVLIGIGILVLIENKTFTLFEL